MTKLRADSWAAALSEEQSWELYYKARRSAWQDAVSFAVKEYALEATPGRSAFYAWLSHMRSEEAAHRLELQRQACLEAAAIAEESPLADEVTVQAYKQMAVETALRTGDAKEAERFVQMAATITDRMLKKQELSLKVQAEERKAEELKIAQEKLKIEQAKSQKACETIANTAMTPEEREAKLKEIFGL